MTQGGGDRLAHGVVIEDISLQIDPASGSMNVPYQVDEIAVAAEV